MKKIISGIILALLLTSMLMFESNIQQAKSSEPPATEWSRTYGGTGDEHARSIIKTSDGGYALAGWTESFGAGGHDFWLVKVDPSGNHMWNQTYGGTSDDDARSMIQTSDGGYAIAGWTGSFNGPCDFWLVKTFSNGTEHWNQTYHNDNIDRANAIIETNDGGYVMAGLTGPSGLGRDAWLVKTNSTGHIQWNRTYGGAGSCNDEAISLVQTDDGGYALAGLTYCFGVGWIDAWLVKTNSTGHIQWNRTYGGAGDDGAYSVVETDDEGYTLAGYTSSFGVGDYDFWLIRTSSNGNEEWNMTYGGTNDEGAYYMVQTGDRGYAMAGATGAFGERDFLLVKTDSAGNMQWNVTYGGTNDEAAYSLAQTQDGGYAMAGWTESFGAGNSDFWLIKLSQEYGWSEPQQLTTDPAFDHYSSIMQDSNGKIWLAWFRSAEGEEALLCKTSLDGGISWSAEQVLETSISSGGGTSLLQDSTGRIWLVWGSRQEGSNGADIFYKTCEDDLWSDTQRLTDYSGDENIPSIIETSGEIWVVFAWSDVNIWYKKTSIDSIVWSDRIQLTSHPNGEACPHAMVDSTGRIWLVWTREMGGSNEDIHYKTSIDYGASWSPEARLTTHPTQETHPSIIEGVCGKIFVFYEICDPTSDIRYVTTIDGGDTWSEYQEFTAPSLTINGDPNAALINNEVWVVWHSDRSGNYDIWMARIVLKVITLPAGAWYIGGQKEDAETILHSIDVDSETPGDQQIVCVSPGETISITYTFQMWSGGGPGVIKQALFAYSWASSWPPWDAYTPLYDGGSGGYYPGFYETDTVSVTVPTTPGEYDLWFCSEAQYSMNQAIQGFTEPPTMLPHAKIVVISEEPEALDPWEYCPYVYLDYGYGFPWDTTPDLPVNVLHTGTYFWGDLRVIQYWFHWNVDYKWWPLGFLKSAIDYTKGEDWVSPLRQPETIGGVGWDDWEPVIVVVDDEGSIDYVLWRWHHNWLKFDLTISGAELFHPTYEETHIKLWWAIGCHTPLTKYFAIDIPILLKIASLLKTPVQFNPVIGQEGDLTKPPLYELYEQGTTYPCGMQQWDEDLALNLGFDPSDLKYVNNPTIAYSELVPPWTPILKIIANSPVNILVTAPNGLRIGYDSVTQTIVNEIEGATYSGPGTEPQVVDIPSPLPGVYNIDIVGTDSGVYTIVIWSLTEDGLVAGIETHGGETVEGGADYYSVSMSETGEMEVVSWECVFEDTRRGTMLKISTDDKYFQFIAPDREFSIREAYTMRFYKHSIFIWHRDEEIELVVLAIDTRIDYCFAYAKDMQTGKRYILLDKPGIEF